MIVQRTFSELPWRFHTFFFHVHPWGTMSVMVKTIPRLDDGHQSIHRLLPSFTMKPLQDGETKVWQFDGNLASHSKPIVHIHTKRGPTDQPVTPVDTLATSGCLVMLAPGEKTWLEIEGRSGALCCFHAVGPWTTGVVQSYGFPAWKCSDSPDFNGLVVWKNKKSCIPLKIAGFRQQHPGWHHWWRQQVLYAIPKW